jgi:predicted small lipoprotein YifL
VPANQEPAVTKLSTLHAAAIVAIAAALLLGGCGRKGRLDAPPTATPASETVAPQAEATPDADAPRDLFGQPQADPDEKPVTTGRKRRLPMDVLLN